MDKQIRLLLMQFFGIHVHDWGEWVDFQHGDVVSPKTKAPTGYYCTQKRTCRDCNKIELRKEQI